MRIRPLCLSVAGLAVLGLSACHGAASNSATPVAIPVIKSPALSSSCVMGYELPGYNSYGILDGGMYSGFRVGQSSGEILQGNYYSPAMAYQLTLTDNSEQTADVSGFAVVFYDSSGNEAGSDQFTASAAFITPGHALMWTMLADTTVDGDGTGGTDGSIPVQATTCDLIKWYSGE